MSVDSALLYSFLLVFVRCSAMLFSSPVFGAQNTPLLIRVMTTFSISGALTLALRPALGGPPADLYGLSADVLHEAVAGLLIGTFMNLILQMAQMAGALIDIQMGLGISQTLNPIDGVPVTVIGQFKFLLAMVLFLSVNGHHMMFEVFARSYESMPINLADMEVIKQSFVGLIGAAMLGAIQIAAPVLAVSLVVDAALGLINKAVPQLQPIAAGMPAKIAIGMMAIALTLPALVNGVSGGIDMTLKALAPIFHA